MRNVITTALIAILCLTSCEKSEAETKAQYDIVQMGTYQQDGQMKESINWVVLRVESDRVLLMSRDLLSSRPWDVTGANKTYDKSSIRQWLNNDFLSAAFSAEEQDAILATELDNSDQHGYGTQAGANTTDKVFLLSVNEYETYVKNSGYKTARATAFAKSEGAYTNGQGNAAWWLRSPGVNIDSPAYLSSAGDLGSRAHEATESIIGIRPAVWVKASFSDGGAGDDTPQINVRQIWERYDQDPNKHEPTYSGSEEKATGIIKYIGRDSHGTPSMELAEEAGGTSYVLGVFGSFDEMSSVSVGMTVTISGNFHIMSSENMVVLKSCKIQKVYNTAGISHIESRSSSDIAWYDLQGRSVQNPSKGIFIAKSENQTKKIFIK